MDVGAQEGEKVVVEEEKMRRVETLFGRWRKITPFTGHGGWMCERGECMCFLVDRWKCASPKCIHFTSLAGCSSRRVANIPTVLDKLTLSPIATPRLPYHSHPTVPHCGSLSLAPPLLPALRFNVSVLLSLSIYGSTTTVECEIGWVWVSATYPLMESKEEEEEEKVAL
ncbi:unnamed protein product [Hydatigera taeniaeformis]|uniref:Uncharacterized protein n=1 Tax=Hydatigena taeniaeformis TaxID=6205 RepID=A0A0R3XAJ7_HYDTA|nr:unnamed protein product [Hydatigera taeniaeformis]